MQIGLFFDAWPSTCYIQDNGCNIGSQGFGDWYWISKVPMIRMNLGNLWTTGISDNTLINNFNVYPNPASNKVTIEINNSKDEKISISLKDILGKEVFVKQLETINAKQVIDVSNLVKGVYLLEITTQNGRVVKQLLVE